MPGEQNTTPARRRARGEGRMAEAWDNITSTIWDRAYARGKADGQAEVERLRAAAEQARSLIDRHMGDTDPADADHPLLLACQTLSEVLAND